MTTDSIKQIINASSFASEYKNRLNALVPQLEKNMLDGLVEVVDNRSNSQVALSITGTWELLAGFLQGFKVKDFKVKNDFFTYMESQRNGLDEDDQQSLLYLVLDLRNLSSKLGLTDVEVQKLLDYEMSMFWQLSKQEVLYLLGNKLLYMQSKTNLLKDVQVVTYDKGWGKFANSFVDVLQNNSEVLGVEGGKPVSWWIKEFIGFSAGGEKQGRALQVGVFLVKHPQAARLNESFKKTLGEIVRLYLWFLDPVIDEDEVLNYKAEVRTNQAKQWAKMFAQDFSPAQDSKVEQLISKVPVEVPKSVEVVHRPGPKPVPEGVRLPPIRDRLLNKNVNVQEILKSRLEKQGNLTGLTNKPRTLDESVLSSSSFQINIDEKLEALKKRKGPAKK